MISTVPTLLQRQGVFTEAIAGRVPAIYDPATTVPGAAAARRAVRSPATRFPSERMDPVARALLERYPLPTSAGTANNYRRVDNETVDQDQFSLRIDHRFPTNRDQVFGRLTRFQEDVHPGDAAARGQRRDDRDARPARHDVLVVRVQLPADVLEQRLERAAHRRHAADGRPDGRRSWAASASASLDLPGIPSTARFPNTLPTFLIGGYQQLGSPPNTASDFSTSVTRDRRHPDVAEGTAHVQDGRGPAVGAAQRRAAAVADRAVHVQQPLHQSADRCHDGANTGTPLASFLLGQVQLFSIDLQQEEIRNRAHFQEYFIQDDWRLSDRVTVNGGVRYTLNFPSTEENDQVAVFNLQTQQLEYLGRDGQPRAARQLHKLNFGPRLGIVGRITDKTVVRTGYGMVWIEMAGITTPFTTPVFPFLQTVSQRTLDNITPAFTLAAGPSVEPIPLTPNAGLGQGCLPSTATWARATSSSGTRRFSASSRRTSPWRWPTSVRRLPASAFPTRT